ncbi:LysR family transcriptional regulator [Nocardia sp. NPDC088792]|uniref:LysR family transcriptional regulator n=1 Tax=Nocardia sp. NPDC088792 TaxID=3364332 RepID=UPI0038308469
MSYTADDRENRSGPGRYEPRKPNYLPIHTHELWTVLICARENSKVEIRQLRRFVALAEEGGFARAAAREYIVQSGLSSTIRALEKDVGAELYRRGSHPVRLTAEGEALLPIARRILDATTAAYDAIHAVRGLLAGSLRVGTYFSTQHLVPLTEWIAEFGSEHPDLSIRVQRLPSRQMVQMVADGDLDCAVVTPLSGYPDHLELLALASEPMVLICPPQHRLFTTTEITLDQLDGERFVETQPTWATRVYTDRMFAAASLTRIVMCEVSDWPMVVELVAAGLGIAFVPRGLVDPVYNPPLVHAITVTGLDFHRRLDLALLPRGQASPAACRFADHIAQRLRPIPLTEPKQAM